MALTSPGVEVSVIDESQYLPSASNSIPFILLATAQNKATPTSTSVAQGTTAANAGKVFRVTSQRDLVTLYGNPFFYNTTNGTPINGYELNEYGLLTAYSALGATNTVYCLRADVDLASLVGQTGRPTGNVADGTYWLDTTSSSWGIYEFSKVTGQFTLKTPIVITDSDLVIGGAPLQSVGSIGDYAVVAIPTYSYASAADAGQYYYKTPANTWAEIGSKDWMAAWPTVQAVNSNPTLTAGDSFVINIGGGASATITVPASPNNTVAQIAAAINAYNYTYLSASVDSGKLRLYSKQTGQSPSDSSALELIISAGFGTVLADIGITAGTYYQPHVTFGTSAQQPLWQTGQTVSRPTGSVWVKIGSAGSGLNTAISRWSASTAAWVPSSVSYATDDFAAIHAIDSTGGKNIAAGSIYAQYNYYNSYAQAPVYYWQRSVTGPTVVVGSNVAPSFTNGPYTVSVSISVPGSATPATYSVSLGDNTNATDFVTAWSAAAIPYTTASVAPSGAIQLVHTEGGVISINDFTAAGTSSGFCAEAGFIIGSTVGVKEGVFATKTFTPLAVAGVGTGLRITVANKYQNYNVNPTTFVTAGTGYTVGDVVTFLGTDLGGATPANDLRVTVTSVGGSGEVTGLTFYSGTPVPAYTTLLSNWIEVAVTANEGAPVSSPSNLTNWFYSVADEVDIMVNTASGWRGYQNIAYDSHGFPQPVGIGTNTTDPAGPIVLASAPTSQSDGTALAYGDIWIDTSDLENYPVINRWQSVSGEDKWVRIDNADNLSASGVVFADARWAASGAVDVSNDPLASISSLLSSNYVDLDAPASSLYPVGTLLFNTRRSGYNVKQFRANYFNNTNFPGASLPTERDAWVSASGLQSDGSPYMGRKAQRAMIVQALKAAIDSNTAIRDEDNNFNLIAAPGYPELQANMITLNADRGETAHIVGDTPMRLADDATAIQNWATNAAGASSTGEKGLVTRSANMSIYYPSGVSNDLSGNTVVVPASYMMLRTFLRNDIVAYPWLAAAGTRRGVIENASGIGYIDATSGEFVSIKTRVGIRDVLYTNQINPLVFFTGNGLLNYGNKTSTATASSLDRVNASRLVAYLRRQLTLATRPFIYEPNDALTRQQVASTIESLMVDLASKRGVTDWLVVCDSSNNTPARIDRSELWVDIAVEITKSVEFVYIPVRLLNTGEISSL